MFFVDAILLGAAAAFIITFVRSFFRFRRGIIVAEIAASSAILKLDSVLYQGKELFLVYEQAKNKFVTQGLSVEEVSKFIVENYKGKTVFVVEDGKDAIKLFSYTENP